MRAETTAGFIIGGQKEQLYETFASLNPNNSNIFPYFGPSVSQAYWGSGTDPAQLVLNDAQWYLTIDYSNLQLENTFTVPATQLDTETMLCAALGDFESFWNWVFTYGQGTQPWYYATVILGLAEEAYIKDVKKGTMSGKPNQGKVIADTLKASRTSSIYRDMNRIYDFLHQMSEEFYGKAFLVTVPFVCTSIDTDTNKLVLSDEPTDRGWREPGSTISVVGGSVSNGQLMGLTVGSSATDFFADDVGKLEGFLRWNFAFQNFDNNVASTQDGFITVPNDSAAVSFYMKATVNPQWYYFRRTATSSLEIAALLTISTPVKLYNQLIDQNYIMHLGRNFRTGSLPSGLAAGLLNSVSPADAVDAASVPYSFPYGAVVPVRSNTRTYGPWYKGAPNAVGKVYTEKDDGFVPWEYGGASYMTQGAQLRLDNKVTDMEKSERGSVTVAGYPEKQLGTALSDSPILLGARSLSIYTANPYSYFYLNVGGLSTKISQITDMSVSVSPSEINTTYTLSSFTPQFGRFTRGNEERLKQLAQQRFRTNKKLRASLFQGGSVNNFAQRIYQNFANSIGSTNLTHRSAPLFLVGKYFDDESNGMKRKQVASISDGDLSVFADYNNSALMSLDGIFRPVQNRNSTVSGIPIENAAGSPSYNYQRTFSESPAGPLDNYTGVIINTDYMRFLSNPSGSGLQNAQIFNTQGSGSILAHDIETVGRSGVDDFVKPNNAFDSGYLSIQDNTLVKYTDDYRYLAMRGPLVVHGWGYDLMGKPIPNQREDVPYYPPGGGSPTSGSPFSGNHRTDYHNLSDYFYEDWLGKPDTWPTAPVDLRYDRRRGVWTIPNDFRLYLANLDSGISGIGDTTTATVYNAEDLYDISGAPLTGVDGISTAQITVTMPLNESIDADRTLVYYSHESGQWWPLGFCCTSEGGGGGGGGTCLVGDTLIETPYGNVEIKDLDIGDEVITHQGTGIVEQIMSAMVDETLEIGFTDNTYIRCTTSHPFALQGRTEDLFDEAQYVQAGYLYEGQTLLGPNGENKIIKGTALLKQKKKIYNLTVSNGHTYISNGIYSHNKTPAPCPACPDSACTWECTSAGWILSTDCVQDNHPSGNCVCYNPCSDAECTRLQSDCGCNSGATNDPRPRCVTAGLCVRDWCDDTRPGDCPNIDCGGGGPIV